MSLSGPAKAVTGEDSLIDLWYWKNSRNSSETRIEGVEIVSLIPPCLLFMVYLSKNSQSTNINVRKANKAQKVSNETAKERHPMKQRNRTPIESI